MFIDAIFIEASRSFVVFLILQRANTSKKWIFPVNCHKLTPFYRIDHRLRSKCVDKILFLLYFDKEDFPFASTDLHKMENLMASFILTMYNFAQFLDFFSIRFSFFIFHYELCSWDFILKIENIRTSMFQYLSIHNVREYPIYGSVGGWDFLTLYSSILIIFCMSKAFENNCNDNFSLFFGFHCVKMILIFEHSQPTTRNENYFHSKIAMFRPKFMCKKEK